MVVKVYVGENEVLVFAMVNGIAVGERDYFGKNNRNKEDYDASLEELPLSIESRGLCFCCSMAMCDRSVPCCVHTKTTTTCDQAID